MDMNLNNLKREILEYLEASEFAVFHSTPGGLDGLPMVLWDSTRFPDYQLFLETARKVGVRLILVATREFESADVDDLMEQLEQGDMERDERRDVETRLRDMRAYDGSTCSLELAFDVESRLYVFELRPEWYDDFLVLEDEIAEHLPIEGDIDDESLGGYFSRN